MQLTRTRILVTGAALALASAGAALSAEGESPDFATQAIVKVYSDGKLVETYHAVDRGRADGDCYRFRVKRGVRELEVRVCGTYVVEQLR